MRVYLAGAMRGIAEFNFPAFAAATEQLRERGHEVFSPAERDLAEGFDPTGMTGHEDLAELGFDLREALGADLHWITTHAEAVVLLPGWARSKGVAAEIATANALGIPVHELDVFLGWVASGGGDQWYVNNPEAFLEVDPPDTGVPGVTPKLAGSTSEVRTRSATGGEKGRKPCEVGAVDPLAREELGKVAGFGAEKYSRGNYLLGYDWSLCVDAMHRHMLAFESGEDRDPESGLLHTAHAAWHGLALCSFVLRGIGTDDRYDRSEDD